MVLHKLYELCLQVQELAGFMACAVLAQNDNAEHVVLAGSKQLAAQADQLPAASMLAPQTPLLKIIHAATRFVSKTACVIAGSSTAE